MENKLKEKLVLTEYLFKYIESELHRNALSELENIVEADNAIEELNIYIKHLTLSIKKCDMSKKELKKKLDKKFEQNIQNDMPTITTKLVNNYLRIKEKSYLK
ncbi:hypothetical protein [Staphylococcus devriesei]|uniref:Uncharacterized protein n=1 Tax=Staphylococcus devriesei TaxID=586733 RepID=A0A2K4DVT7_9STAP|nr:hypothetical protein [Staphylococcus devriesei]MCE5090505.1 hypothetical protein [Staphylococcus devriesei]MCE5096632.1 hypothetical protein [Staphylococcus devriesei]PNZ90574.1 hypothetical protein CD147_00115 [Staphylococcus devriesei]PTF03417.1 hypothetical protein BUY45_08675 [Staphylococcus devriesei]PTF10975.1 hypothetical protein BUY48_10770 [Staphylococcus devriesei]